MVLHLAVIALLCQTALCQVTAPLHRPSTDIGIEDRYIVKLKQSHTYTELINLCTKASNYATQNNHDIDFEKLFTNAFLGFTGHMDAAMLSLIQTYPEVDYVEQDVEISEFATPGHLDRIDQHEENLDNNPYTALGDRNAAGVNIYIVDSGVRADHEQFDGNVGFVPDESEKCDFMQGESAPTPLLDYCGHHGTGVAAVVSGRDYGVANHASLWDVRALAACNHPENVNYLSDALHGLDMVIHHGKQPAVVLLAFGTTLHHDSFAFRDVTNYMEGQGYVFVMAAGNGGDACNYLPGSLTASGIVVGYAMTGTPDLGDVVFGGNTGPCVSLFAPGVDVETAGVESTTDTVTMTGSSLAAAAVAGTAALVIAAEYPDDVTNQTPVNPQDIKDSIIGRATENTIYFYKSADGAPDRLVYAGP